MLRKSSAERALGRQIKWLKAQLVNYAEDQRILNEKVNSVRGFIDQLESEIERSREDRIKASESRKP